MIRALSVFSLATVLLTILSLPVMILQPGAFVLGGHYHIGPGETLDDDIRFYFAQVTVDDGAEVNGQVFLYSSTLDLYGNVAQDIHAFESDMTLHENAHVYGKIDQTDLIHWTLLLPAIVWLP